MHLLAPALTALGLLAGHSAAQYGGLKPKPKPSQPRPSRCNHVKTLAASSSYACGRIANSRGWDCPDLHVTLRASPQGLDTQPGNEGLRVTFNCQDNTSFLFYCPPSPNAYIDDSAVCPKGVSGVTVGRITPPKPPHA
ncbi:hypothetical protein E4U42_005366 [Claviceps africana]|uniref:Uncharacterized protein n=1 Tax=Claviceps africana TaxID=83212 RepID=A0A8K0NGE1_9HYPO|nr:hypothetical protein E4U42_005366 [Claviceps africana]